MPKPDHFQLQQIMTMHHIIASEHIVCTVQLTDHRISSVLIFLMQSLKKIKKDCQPCQSVTS